MIASTSDGLKDTSWLHLDHIGMVSSWPRDRARDTGGAIDHCNVGQRKAAASRTVAGDSVFHV